MKKLLITGFILMCVWLGMYGPEVDTTIREDEIIMYGIYKR